MINTHVIILKNRRLRVRLGLGFFYSELAPTYLLCNMFQTLLGRKQYEEAKHPGIQHL